MQTNLTMMALGPYRFGCNTAAYQSFERSAAYRWASQTRIGRLPASQFMGADAQGVTLQGVIYPGFKGGLNQVETMRTVAGLGRPLMMTNGYGRSLGRWVILSISETSTVFFGDGAPRKIEFTLTLRQYGEDSA